MSLKEKKTDKIVSLVERSEKAKHAGIDDALEMALQQFTDGEIDCSRIIIIMDQEDTNDVHLFLSGVDMWSGITMCEIAKNKLMFDEGEE